MESAINDIQEHILTFMALGRESVGEPKMINGGSQVLLGQQVTLN